MTDKTITLSPLDLSIVNTIISGNLSLIDYGDNGLSGNIAFQKFNLTEWQNLLPDIKKMNASGNVDGNISLSGTSEDLKYKGFINLANISMNPPELTKPVKNLNAKKRS